MAQREFQVIRENSFMEENWYQNGIYAVFWNDGDIWEKQSFICGTFQDTMFPSASSIS